MKTCKACQTEKKDWNGDDRQCAFPNGGEFCSSNWNCATANKIRDICDNPDHLPTGVHYRYCDDQKYAVIPCDEIEEFGALCMVVVWYKRRGGTDSIVLIGDEGPRPPTEKECLVVIDHYQKNNLSTIKATPP